LQLPLPPSLPPSLPPPHRPSLPTQVLLSVLAASPRALSHFLAVAPVEATLAMLR
jgi:hypothetical protein